MSYGLNHLEQMRMWSFRNATDEEIPGYAIMRLGEPDDEWFAQKLQDKRKVIWQAYKPDEELEAFGEAAGCVFNSKVPIKPGKIGQCTFDFPARVLHDGSKDSLPNWRPCGPKADSWEIYSGRPHFICHCHDISGAISKNSNGVHTVWVSPGSGRNLVYYGYWIGGGVVADQSEVSFQKFESSQAGFSSTPTKGLATLTFKGVYQITFHAKISSPSAPRGTALTVQLYRRRTPEGIVTPTDTALPVIGTRDQLIETDEGYSTAATSAENVAFTTALAFEARDEVWIKNVSGHSLSLVAAGVSIHRLGHNLAGSANSGLVYPP